MLSCRPCGGAIAAAAQQYVFASCKLKGEVQIKAKKRAEACCIPSAEYCWEPAAATGAARATVAKVAPAVVHNSWRLVMFPAECLG